MCRWASGRAGGSTRGPRHWGAAWEGLGMRDRRVWGRGGSAGWDGRLGRAGLACSCVCIHVHVCSCMESRFPWSFLWGREGMLAGEGLGVLNWDEALGWFLRSRAGSIRVSQQRPCWGPGWPPAPPNPPWHHAGGAKPRCLPRVVPLSCACRRPRTSPGGRVPLR